MIQRYESYDTTRHTPQKKVKYYLDTRRLTLNNTNFILMLLKHIQLECKVQLYIALQFQHQFSFIVGDFIDSRRSFLAS